MASQCSLKVFYKGVSSHRFAEILLDVCSDFACDPPKAIWGKEQSQDVQQSLMLSGTYLGPDIPLSAIVTSCPACSAIGSYHS